LFVFKGAVMLSEAKHLRLSSRTEPESSAVDVNGIRHRRSKYGDRIPWNADPIKFVEPDYPAELRARHAEGTGLFRVTVDVNTGGVTNVGVIKSTGYAALDDSAMRAIRLWRWRARRWKEIDTPLNFGKKACELSHWERSGCNDTLAAAYAEAGIFTKPSNTRSRRCRTLRYRPRNEKNFRSICLCSSNGNRSVTNSDR
jgi:TonB family protein